LTGCDVNNSLSITSTAAALSSWAAYVISRRAASATSANNNAKNLRDISRNNKGVRARSRVNPAIIPKSRGAAEKLTQG
jgi:hypothetical protein